MTENSIRKKLSSTEIIKLIDKKFKFITKKKKQLL